MKSKFCSCGKPIWSDSERCRDCYLVWKNQQRAEQRKIYRESEQGRIMDKIYRESRREQKKEKDKIYREQHKQELQKYFREHYKKNLRKIKEYKKEYYQKNKPWIMARIIISGHKFKYRAKQFNLSTAQYNMYRKKCVACNCDIPALIDIHHIDKNKQNNNLNNLIPLCANHHMMIHRLHIPVTELLDTRQKNELEKIRSGVKNGDTSNVINRDRR